ncbi:efflux RND transporter permease subunit [Priestia taiwanensis]|uniref:Swarming motility protein SwrC n=1 Tax=Priestia taiwanensis TaxID=1347902 RepID=A0A917AMF8_9BACI|nr:efflux RND transporter permease subunit [Priestia taiwanensis]MBM7362217.1 HAE1 family hydrophobic/amphiphilic exporter-1 [Priestia taiwanensis]GGE60396.1 swarming motility protein SwrC [Priestia taiwanensis]
MFFARFSLKNVAAVFVVSFLLILGGLYSFRTLKIDMMPNIEIPQIVVQVVYPGASPGDVDEQIMKKTDKRLMGIEGIKNVNGTAMNNIAVYQLDFEYGTDMEKAISSINTVLSEVEYPDGIQKKVERISMDRIPIYFVSIYGDEETNKMVNDKIIPALEKLDGVGDIMLEGQKDRVVMIEIDQQKALANGLMLQTVKKSIEDSNFAFPAGTITSEDNVIPIQIKKELTTTEALKSIQLQGINGVIPLSDVASITAEEQYNSISRYGDKEAMMITLMKKPGANTVETVKEIQRVIDLFDDDMEYTIGYSQGDEIQKSVDTLVKEGIYGAIFASLSVLLFLRNIRATFIAIISIPLSLLITSIFLKQLDISLNMMSLGGMAVAIGRVVDDSIVVIENIFRRIRKESKHVSDELIISSTGEILKAIVSSTVVTAIVFLPMGFVTGMTGEIFYPFAITVVVALFASLLVSVTLVPILSKFSFKKVKREEKEGKLQTLYEKLLRFSLQKKWIVLVVSFVLLGTSFFFVSRIGFVMMPNEKQKILYIGMELPPSTSLEKANETSQRVEKMILDREYTDGTFSTVGGIDVQTGVAKTNMMTYYINLKTDADIEVETKELKEDIPTLLKDDFSDIKLTAVEMGSGQLASTLVTIDLFDTNLERLQENAAKVEEYMAKQSNVKEVKNNFKQKQAQWSVVIDDKKATSAGITNEMVLGLVAERTTPISVSVPNLDKAERKILLSYAQKATTKQDIEKILLPTKSGVIPLSEVASVKEESVFNSIQKKDGKIFARITADLNSTNIAQDTLTLTDGVKKDVILDSEVDVTFGGSDEETKEAFEQLGVAMVVAIGLVFVVMLLTFKKLRIPFIILTSLLFIPIGSFSALYITKEPLSLSSMIGLLMLIGIVTTNAIVLVDRIGQNRDEKKLSIRAAIIEAGKTRLNPILMTALATIAALLPLALSTSQGTLISKGLAIVVIGGLTTSTLLTLLIVPVMYELFHFRMIKKERAKSEKITPNM